MELAQAWVENGAAAGPLPQQPRRYSGPRFTTNRRVRMFDFSPRLQTPSELDSLQLALRVLLRCVPALGSLDEVQHWQERVAAAGSGSGGATAPGAESSLAAAAERALVAAEQALYEDKQAQAQLTLEEVVDAAMHVQGADFYFVQVGIQQRE